jgi:hypothetical protein
MSGFTYRFAYLIDDEELTIAQVTDEALRKFPVDAARRGIHITGPVTTRIDEDRVVCEAAAQPIPGRRVSAADKYGLWIEELARIGLSDEQIGREVGVSGTTVGGVRKELDIPAGRTRRKEMA